MVSIYLLGDFFPRRKQLFLIGTEFTLVLSFFLSGAFTISYSLICIFCTSIACIYLHPVSGLHYLRPPLPLCSVFVNTGIYCLSLCVSVSFCVSVSVCVSLSVCVSVIRYATRSRPVQYLLFQTASNNPGNPGSRFRLQSVIKPLLCLPQPSDTVYTSYCTGTIQYN